MTLNVDKNKDALVAAWRDVMDEKVPTDWALFGYDGLSYDLNLVSKGDGGLEELIEDFNSGKIMYALCRVKLKEKNVEKIVLINWQGEGAPLARKGTCANHVSEVKNFFKGIHVTINARTDEDVEPDVVIQCVAKATAGDGVKHLMSNDVETLGPVGTTYKKTNAVEDINSSAKDEFWRKEEQEEERRKKDEQNKFRKFSQNEVKLLRRESEEYFHREEVSSVTNNKSPASGMKINGTPPSSTNNTVTTSTSNNTPVSNNTNNATHFTSAAAVKASTPRKNSAGSAGDLVRQRIKSFDTAGPPLSPTQTNGINSSNGGSNGKTETLSVLKRRQMFEGGNSNATPPIPRTNPAQEIKLAQEKAQIEQAKQDANRNISRASPAASTATSAAVINKVKPDSYNTIKSPPTPDVIPAVSPQQQRPVSPARPPQQSVSPVQPPQSFSPVQPPKAASPVPPPQAASPVPPPMAFANPVVQTEKVKITEVRSNNTTNNTNGFNNSGKDVWNQKKDVIESNNKGYSVGNGNSPLPPEMSAPVSSSPAPSHDLVREEASATPILEILPEMGVCARALYDYQAADESEITFDPGEIITNIEKIDEGWWEGLGPHGIYGLFPANYVELLN